MDEGWIDYAAYLALNGLMIKSVASAIRTRNKNAPASVPALRELDTRLVPLSKGRKNDSLQGSFIFVPSGNHFLLLDTDSG